MERQGAAAVPTDSELSAAERDVERGEDRQGVGGQILEVVVSAGRFWLTLGALAGSFLLIGATLFWVLEDLLGLGLGSGGEYAVVGIAGLLAIYTTVTLRRLVRKLVGMRR